MILAPTFGSIESCVIDASDLLKEKTVVSMNVAPRIQSEKADEQSLDCLLGARQSRTDSSSWFFRLNIHFKQKHDDHHHKYH